MLFLNQGDRIDYNLTKLELADQGEYEIPSGSKLPLVLVVIFFITSVCLEVFFVLPERFFDDDDKSKGERIILNFLSTSNGIVLIVSIIEIIII